MKLLNKAVLLIFLNISVTEFGYAAEAECTILLHGLGRTHQSMAKIEDSLTFSGYKVWNESYPSRDQSIEQLASLTIETALKYCRSENATPINFVTHSLGGILIRFYLQDNNIEGLGKIVMIGPPNQGSEVVDLLGELKIFQRLLGPAGGQLGTSDQSVPNKLGPLKTPIGIIAGTRSSDPWFNSIFDGDNDGKVSVESTKLDEMTDFVTVEHGHTFIMRQRNVIQFILQFLKTGSFDTKPNNSN